MPNCFQLIDKKTGESVSFQDVDEKMCQHFRVPVSDKYYYKQWYETIGLGFAWGVPEEKIRSTFPELVSILDWILANYTVDAWAERGGRRD